MVKILSTHSPVNRKMELLIKMCKILLFFLENLCSQKNLTLTVQYSLI